MKKRMISLVLVLCLLLGILPTAVLASEGTALDIHFNQVPINQDYMNWAQVSGAVVTGATRLEATPEEGENGRVHIQVELGQGTQNGDTLHVEMNVSKPTASGIGYALRAQKGALEVGAPDELYYAVEIENGVGQMVCYSYYNSSQYTTLVLDFVVGDKAGTWVETTTAAANDKVLNFVRIWDQPVMKTMFLNTGDTDPIPGTGGVYQGLAGYIWLEESVPDDASIGLELDYGGSKILELPDGWNSRGGYVQLENGEAMVQFNLQGWGAGVLGQNRRVTLYIKNHLSHAPELLAGDTVNLQTEAGVPYVLDLRDYFADRDGEELTYLVSVDGTEVVSQTSYKYRYNPAEPGVRTLEISAMSKDGVSETCTIVLTAGTDHVWGEWTVLKAATCTEDGSRTHTCTCCYVKETETITARGSHSWDEWITKNNANCVDDGVKLRTCMDCGAVERGTIPAGEHDWVVTTTATCGKAGVQTAACPGCGQSKTTNVPATGEHTWGKWLQTTAATCADPGLENRVCGICGETEERQISATGNHIWGVWNQTIAPSCKDGERTRTCTICAESQTAAIAANGQHNWGEWMVTVTPTISQPGTEVRTCVGCSEFEIRTAYYKTPCVYINYSNAGESVLALAEVPLEDCNGIEGITLDDVLLMANTIYGPSGASGYETNGEFVTMFWGNSGAFGYCINHEFAMGTHDAVADGDIIDFFVYEDVYNYSDNYGYFDKSRLEIKAGESFTLTCYRIPNSVNSSPTAAPAAGVQIVINGEMTDYYTDTNGQVTLTLEKGGDYEISAVANLYTLVPPICLVKVDSNQTMLDAPVLTGAIVTATTITVTPPELSLIDPAATVEYSLRLPGERWSEWQTGNVFTKLTNATDYEVRARYITSDAAKYITSDASQALTVTTGAGPSAVYTFGDVTAQAGQIIQIPVHLVCEAEDVWKWNAKLHVDTDVFTLLSIEPGKDADGWSVKLNHVTHCVNGTLPMGQSVDNINGEMFLLNLQVKETVQPGDYTVTLGSTWNIAGQNAFWNVNRAYVTVAGQVNDACVTVTDGQAVPEATFGDVSDETWYYESVQYMALSGLMKGTGADAFSPDVTTSRAMLVTLLYRMEGEPEGERNQPFLDVKADSYYADAVAWAAANGIVKGVSDTEFAPDDPVTREQTATILYRYAQWHGQTTSAAELSSFADADAVSAFAFDAMQWAVAEGILQGYSNQLMPGGSTSRAQMATILSRYLGE